MILKKTTRKTLSFRQLLYYIRSDKGRSAGYEHFFIAHNLSSFKPADIVREFEANDAYRTRSKVTMYHEVLAFHPGEDRAYLTQDVLKDIAEKYIQIRNPNALVYAMPHMVDDHVHIHFMFSGTEFESRASLRMNNKEFARVRTAIEDYQLERYPDLVKSIVYRGKTKQPRNLGTREFQMVQRLGGAKKKSQKEQITDLLVGLVQKAKSVEDFLGQIGQTELQVYERSGIPTGVIGPGGKKYRFKTVGITSEQIQVLEERELGGLSKIERKVREMKGKKKGGRGR